MPFDPISYSAAKQALARGIYPRPDLKVPATIYHTEDPTNAIRAALRRGYEFIWARELVDALEGKGTLPPKPALLTYDDCRTALYTVAHPVIEAFGVKATVFVTSDFVDGEPVDPSLQPFGPGATWEQLRTMHATGLYDWQNHTKTHASLGSGTYASRVAELTHCNDRIEAELGAPRPVVVAYPNGIVEGATLPALRDAGMKLGFVYSAAFQGGKSHAYWPVASHPYSLNRSAATDASWLEDMGDEVIVNWMHDGTGERNANNALGYYVMPAGASFARNGGELKLQGLGAAANLDTADYQRAFPGEWFIGRFAAQSSEQTTGTASIGIAEFDADKTLLRVTPFKEFTEAEGYTSINERVQVGANTAFVKFRMSVDASYDGTVSVLYPYVYRA